MQALLSRWGKCLNVNGDYMEVWCVPSAAYVFCISGSQKKVVGVIMPRNLSFEITLHLRDRCATNRKVAGSIPGGVVGIFH